MATRISCGWLGATVWKAHWGGAAATGLKGQQRQGQEAKAGEIVMPRWWRRGRQGSTVASCTAMHLSCSTASSARLDLPPMRPMCLPHTARAAGGSTKRRWRSHRMFLGSVTHFGTQLCDASQPRQHWRTRRTAGKGPCKGAGAGVSTCGQPATAASPGLFPLAFCSHGRLLRCLQRRSAPAAGGRSGRRAPERAGRCPRVPG